MRSIGRVSDDQSITVSLYLKTRDPAGGRSTRAALREARQASHAGDCSAVEAFAEGAGLEVLEQDPARRLIKLRGSASALERAFGTKLHRYEGAGGAVYHGREGALHLPTDMTDRIVAVLGLDTTPIATPKSVPHRGRTPPRGFLPSEVASLYGFADTDASGSASASSNWAAATATATPARRSQQ